jgi:hypothetical protein
MATLSSDHADERIQVVLNRAAGGATISLIQQSWAESLGWYTQKVMELTPEQVRQLRGALGTPTAARMARPAVEQLDAEPDCPACLPFPSLTRRAHSA